MKTALRITQDLLRHLHTDLSRPHPFASERVSFLSCRPASLRNNGVVLLGAASHAVLDDDYVEDNTVGAMLGGSAFRRILQHAYNTPASIFHVHRHEHRG